MMYPEVRLRRLRQSQRMRDLVCETRVSKDELMLPMFFDANISFVKTDDGVLSFRASRDGHLSIQYLMPGVIGDVITFEDEMIKVWYGAKKQEDSSWHTGLAVRNFAEFFAILES